MIEQKMFELQREQWQHDKAYHPEILALSVPNRIAHYVLHYAKYVGRLIEARRKPDIESMKPVVVDSVIITLAFHNMFNLKAKPYKYTEADEVQISDLIDNYAISAGRLAKIAESLDHVEAMDFRSALSYEIEWLHQTLGQIAAWLTLDIANEVRTRWRNVEQKSIFHTGG